MGEVKALGIKIALVLAAVHVGDIGDDVVDVTTISVDIVP
jgi:hypothetical protein